MAALATVAAPRFPTPPPLPLAAAGALALYSAGVGMPAPLEGRAPPGPAVLAFAPVPPVDYYGAHADQEFQVNVSAAFHAMVYVDKSAAAKVLKAIVAAAEGLAYDSAELPVPRTWLEVQHKAVALMSMHGGLPPAVKREVCRLFTELDAALNRYCIVARESSECFVPLVLSIQRGNVSEVLYPTWKSSPPGISLAEQIQVLANDLPCGGPAAPACAPYATPGGGLRAAPSRAPPPQKRQRLQGQPAAPIRGVDMNQARAEHWVNINEDGTAKGLGCLRCGRVGYGFKACPLKDGAGAS
jgi:hypothetical protein